MSAGMSAGAKGGEAGSEETRKKAYLPADSGRVRLDDVSVRLLNEGKTVTEDLVRGAARDPRADVRVKAAASDKCPVDVLRKLAGDERPAIRIEVAGNQRCPSDALAALADDAEPEVRSRAIRNKNATADVLWRILERDREDAGIAKAAAQSKKATPELLTWLSDHENSAVRAMIAKNGNASVDLLIALSADPQDLVRHAVVDRPDWGRVARMLLRNSWDR